MWPDTNEPITELRISGGQTGQDQMTFQSCRQPITVKLSTAHFSKAITSKMFLELCRVFFISYTKLVIPHGLRKQEVGFRMKLELLKYGFHLFQAESSRYKNQPFVTIGELRS